MLRFGCLVVTCHFCMCPPSSVIIISVVEAILLLTLIFLRTRILIAIALIQESSKSVVMSFSNGSFGSLLLFISNEMFSAINMMS